MKATNVEVRLPSRMGFEKVAANTTASVATLMGFREGRVNALKAAVTAACIDGMDRCHPNETRTVRFVLPADEDSNDPEMPA
jgi:serine/threonine-protein kinase RsbW